MVPSSFYTPSEFTVVSRTTTTRHAKKEVNDEKTGTFTSLKDLGYKDNNLDSHEETKNLGSKLLPMPKDFKGKIQKKFDKSDEKLSKKRISGEAISHSSHSDDSKEIEKGSEVTGTELREQSEKIMNSHVKYIVSDGNIPDRFEEDEGSFKHVYCPARFRKTTRFHAIISYIPRKLGLLSNNADSEAEWVSFDPSIAHEVYLQKFTGYSDTKIKNSLVGFKTVKDFQMMSHFYIGCQLYYFFRKLNRDPNINRYSVQRYQFNEVDN
jgi:hypothetical protein